MEKNCNFFLSNVEMAQMIHLTEMNKARNISSQVVRCVLKFARAFQSFKFAQCNLGLLNIVKNTEIKDETHLRHGGSQDQSVTPMAVAHCIVWIDG